MCNNGKINKHISVADCHFDSKNIAYDIKGIQVADLHLASRPGKLAKYQNVKKRGYKIHQLIKQEGIDIAYSLDRQRTCEYCFFCKAEKWQNP